METTLRNIEVKARVADLEHLRQLVAVLGPIDEAISQDVDRYYRVTAGRLKLRRVEGQPYGTLIQYQRADTSDSRPSDYSLLRIDEPERLDAILSAALGRLVTVTKSRHLFLYGATRIHLDMVDGLGTFVELETMLQGQSEADANAEHAFVRQALGLDRHEIVPVSYGDLLLMSSEEKV